MTQVSAYHDAYQQLGRKWILDRTHCALWWRPGKGKTRPTLLAIRDLIWTVQVHRVLVISTKRIAKDVWPAECEKWTPELTCKAAYGTPLKRKQVINDDSVQIVTLSAGCVDWLYQMYRDYGQFPFEMIVIDESSLFAGTKSRRAKAMRQLRNKVDRIVQLTGSPAANSLMKLWGQLYLLDGGERLGRTVTAYRTMYFTNRSPKPQEFPLWEPRPKAKEDIFDAVSDICFALQGDDSANPPLEVNHELSFSPRQRESYKNFVRDGVLDTFGFEPGIFDIASSGALYGKLLQFAGGAVYVVDEETGTRRVQFIHDLKMDALKEIVTEAAGDPILLAYQYKHTLERLQKVFPNLPTLNTPGVIDRWNAGELPLLPMHPKSGGHGLNMQYGGATVVFWDLPDLELYEQFIGRLHGRAGQTRRVIVHRLMIKGTVDMDARRRIRDRDEDQNFMIRVVERLSAEYRRAA
ncbi:MAG: DEAD/DEAH box helicase [Pseudomonadota bacterium]